MYNFLGPPCTCVQCYRYSVSSDASFITHYMSISVEDCWVRQCHPPVSLIPFITNRVSAGGGR